MFSVRPPMLVTVKHTRLSVDRIFDAVLIGCLILITYIGGQERLYCTHERLTIAYHNPSAFCQVSGMHCIYYCVFVCCCCFLEQEALLTLLQSTQLYKWDLVLTGKQPTQL